MTVRRDEAAVWKWKVGEMKRFATVAMIAALFSAMFVPAQIASAAHGSICNQVIQANNAGQDTVDVSLPSGAIESYEVIDVSETGQTFGGSGNQAILGTSASETLLGGSGNDILCGFGGGDTLIGGSGNDQLIGDLQTGGMDQPNPGNDFLLGGSGNDGLYGDDGDDVHRGGSGADFLSGANGYDICEGGSGGNSTDDPTTCEELDL